MRVVIVAMVMAVTPSAGARVLLHHDLTSLALLSDAIVLVERGATRSRSSELRLTEMRVRRVYAGLIATGSTLEVPDESYALDGTPEQPLAGGSRELVLFLVRSGRASPRWWIVASGVRVVSGGRVFRFEQRSNPGPYEPVPQGRDPFDVREGRGLQIAVDLATFEADLRSARARADEVRSSLAPTTDGPPRRDPLFALLPPRQERLAGPGRGLGPYRDEVAYRIVESFLVNDDLDGALEALAHVAGDRPRMRSRRITSETLVTAALDGARPPHRRVEALLALWDPAPPQAAVVERIAPLLSDPIADVRAAAVMAIATAARSSIEMGVRTAAHRLLVTAAPRETDPTVQFALLRADDGELARRMRTPAPAVLARRAGDEVSIAAGWRGRTGFSLELAEVRAAGVPCEARERSTWSAGAMAGLVTRVRCPDPTPSVGAPGSGPAPWSATVSLRWRRTEVRQTIELR